MLAVRGCRNTRRIYAKAVYNRSNMIQRGGTSTFLDIVPFFSIAIHNYLCSLFSTVCYSISFSFKRSFIQNAKSMNVILGGSCRLRVTDASYAQLSVTAYLRSRFYKRAYAKNILQPTEGKRICTIFVSDEWTVWYYFVRQRAWKFLLFFISKI